MITEIGLQYFIALVEEIWRPWKIENQIEGANPDFYMVMYGKIARLWTDAKLFLSNKNSILWHYASDILFILSALGFIWRYFAIYYIF